MGGCCCCSSKDTDSAQNTYYYYPRVSEEHVPLSSNHGAASVFAGGLLVDTNLDTSIPDTYTPPPAPAPFNVTLGPNPTLPVAREICADKTNASAAGANHEASAKLEELKESAGLKVQTDLELRKLVEPIILEEEEDVCPICLEEYDAENPKLTTKCDHYFHLACILEWMERSETCPVCDQVSRFRGDSFSISYAQPGLLITGNFIHLRGYLVRKLK
ncbi:hypothetical protein AHAS_Ahas05G0131000 [Arachis hypogaea]